MCESLGGKPTGAMKVKGAPAPEVGPRKGAPSTDHAASAKRFE